ncbi:MAG: hypothetical protein ACE5IK_11300 [Acidobacteriota bacterium]
MDKQRLRRALGRATLALLLLGVPSVQAHGQLTGSFEAKLDPSQSSSSYLGQWDPVDAAIDLTGLWGSIDVNLDKDPVWTVDSTDGTVFLVWAKYNGVFYEIVYSLRAAGGAWSGVVKVEPTPTSTYDDVTPSIVVDSTGDLNAAWTRLTPGGGTILHSVRVGGPWTPAAVISGTDDARWPEMRVASGRTYVDYRTDDALVTVEIVVIISSGGSDDIDPVTDVTVESIEVGREILPK